jgi:hypothetical protein
MGSFTVERLCWARTPSRKAPGTLNTGPGGTTPTVSRAQLADIASSIIEGPPPIRGEGGYRALQFVPDVYRAAGHGPQGCWE